MAMARGSEDDGYQAYLARLRRYEPLPRELERKLAERWVRRRDKKAAHRLVEANLRFVVKIANGYRNYGLRIDDLVEEGNLGLLEALRRFEPARGHRFMTYAAYWVRAYILAHVLKQRYLVGVGTGPMQSKLFFRLARERARLAASLGDEADLDVRLAATFGTTPERVRAMTGRMEGRDVSLDAEVGEGGRTRAVDLLVDESSSSEERCAAAERSRIVRARVHRALAELPQRERYIIEQRLLSDDGKTLAEIGRELGLSRERVRQLEERVKVKLSRALADLREEGPIEAAA
jgi:RNA polymerase sigma-32 factor